MSTREVRNNECLPAEGNSVMSGTIGCFEPERDIFEDEPWSLAVLNKRVNILKCSSAKEGKNQRDTEG